MDKHKLAIKWFDKGCYLDRHEPESDKAIEAYKKCIKYENSFVSAYINLGFIYIARDEYARAVKYFQWVLELEPNNAEALNNLGYAYEKMDRF